MVDLSPESSAELALEGFSSSGLLDDKGGFADDDELFCRFFGGVAALSATAAVSAAVAVCWAAAAAATQQGKAGRQQFGCEHILAPFCCTSRRYSKGESGKHETCDCQQNSPIITGGNSTYKMGYLGTPQLELPPVIMDRFVDRSDELPSEHARVVPSLQELLFPLPLPPALPLLGGLPQLEGEVEGLSDGEGGRLGLKRK